MKTLIVTILSTTLFASCATAANKLTPEEEAFEKRFNEFSQMGVTLKHHPALDGPWGSPNPDAPPELEQFAFMVGRHDCKQPLSSINPNSPDQQFEGDLLWLAYYALDGRAIRDEFYGMSGNGEQTRAYDPFAKEWWVTFATVPGVVSLVPEPKPSRGEFSAIRNDEGHMVMTAPPAKDADGNEFVNTITFYDITDEGFEWKSANIYADKSISTGTLTCKKVAGPDF